MLNDFHSPAADLSSPVPLAFCITELDPGGAEKALVELLRRLDRNVWSPTVYCLGPEAELAPVIRDMEIPVRCGGATRWQFLSALRWLTKELRAQQPALLQCLLFHANFLGRIAGRRAGVPCILAGHRVAERQQRWHLWLERLTCGMVDHHVCVSQGVARFLRESTGESPGRISVIPNGVDPSPAPPGSPSLREEFQIPADDRLLLAVGRLHPQKRFDLMIRAFAAAREGASDLHLVIIGEGPERERLELLIRSLGLSGRVHLTGFRPWARRWMAEAELVLLSSAWEGMPNVILEAMAEGIPVVTTEVEGIGELVGDRGVGIVVTSDTADAFAMGILEGLAAPAFRQRPFFLSQSIIADEFTWELMAREYEELWLCLLAGGAE